MNKSKYSFTPKPEAVEVVENMIKNCKLEKLDDKHTRVTIRGLSVVILWPYDKRNNKDDIIECILFYHTDVLRGYKDTYYTETEKCLKTKGFKFVEKYLSKYHKDCDKECLFIDYYDR